MRKGREKTWRGEINKAEEKNTANRPGSQKKSLTEPEEGSTENNKHPHL